MQPHPTIDRLVDACNTHDARAFADQFADDARIYELPDILTQSNQEAIFEYYQHVFAQFPQNHTTVLHRIRIGKRVIDHERVQRSPDQEPFEVLTVYEVTDGLISRLDFIRDAQHVVGVA